MSQNNTSNAFELIIISFLFFIFGSFITCHLIKNKYQSPQVSQQPSLEKSKLDEISEKIESLEKSLANKSSLEDKIKNLELQNQEILKALLDLKYSKKEVSVSPSQPTASVDYSKISNMINSKNQDQNLRLSDFLSKIDSLEYKLKECVSNSWINDQKLNEIKDLLSKRQLAPPVVTKPLESLKTEPPRLVKKYVDSVETKPVPVPLSVRSDLPEDYKTPKKVYKVDELK